MSPVFDPDLSERLMPETDTERRAPWVIVAANAALRGVLTLEEWERELEAINA